MIYRYFFGEAQLRNFGKIRSAVPWTLSKRRFLGLLGGTAAFATIDAFAIAEPASPDTPFDVIVVGGGPAGMTTALFAAKRKAKVLVIESSKSLGGTLAVRDGVLVAAGSTFQRSRGVGDDTPQRHFDDILRADADNANPKLLRLAVFNAAKTIDWLTDAGLEIPADFPTTRPPLSSGYSRARYLRGVDGGKSILNILDKQLSPYIASGKVTVMTVTNAVRLIQGKAARVIGVEVKDEQGNLTRYSGRNIVLAAGGYTASAQMTQALESRKNYFNPVFPGARGTGLQLGIDAGGHAGGEKHLPIFGGIFADQTPTSPLVGTVRHWPPDRPPWEIFVNVAGERFHREDFANFSAQARALSKQKDERCWCVFDSVIAQNAPPLIQTGNWSRDKMMAAFDAGQFGFYKADTLEALSRLTGIDPGGLAATVSQYNRAQRHGGDAFGRDHMPKPIIEAPYYALLLQGYGVASSAGLIVDEELRILQTTGAPIPGLYAAGEILGSGQLIGNAPGNGMILTSSLTFGRLLGDTLLKISA